MMKWKISLIFRENTIVKNTLILPLHFDVIFPLPSLVLAEDTPSSDDCDLTENLGKQIP